MKSSTIVISFIIFFTGKIIFDSLVNLKLLVHFITFYENSIKIESKIKLTQDFMSDFVKNKKLSYLILEVSCDLICAVLICIF